MLTLRDIPAAEAYVQTRFFPPLPAIYGDLLVKAVNLCNGDGEFLDGPDPDALIVIPRGTAVIPKAAQDDDGVISIAAIDLVRALRAEHLIVEVLDGDEWAEL